MAKYIVTLRAEVHFDDQPEGLDPRRFVPSVVDALESSLAELVVVIATNAHQVPTEGGRFTPLPGPVPE